jgi:hypothetical protein
MENLHKLGLSEMDRLSLQKIDGGLVSPIMFDPRIGAFLVGFVKGFFLGKGS